MIGKTLKDLREEKGLTQSQLAKELQLSQQSVSNYEKDSGINIDVIVQYAKYFDVSTDYLLGLTDVATSDRDLQYVCDYIGLDETAAITLHILTHGYVGNDFEKPPTESYLNYIHAQKTAANSFLNSICFTDLIERFVDKERYNEEMKNNKNSFILKSKEDLNIYKAQTAVLDYIRRIKTACSI